MTNGNTKEKERRREKDLQVFLGLLLGHRNRLGERIVCEGRGLEGVGEEAEREGRLNEAVAREVQDLEGLKANKDRGDLREGVVGEVERSERLELVEPARNVAEAVLGQGEVLDVRAVLKGIGEEVEIHSSEVEHLQGLEGADTGWELANNVVGDVEGSEGSCSVEGVGKAQKLVFAQVELDEVRGESEGEEVELVLGEVEVEEGAERDEEVGGDERDLVLGGLQGFEVGKKGNMLGKILDQIRLEIKGDKGGREFCNGGDRAVCSSES